MEFRPCHSTALSVVLALALTAISGCVTVVRNGETPEEIKQRLAESPTFHSLSDFYPQACHRARV